MDDPEAPRDSQAGESCHLLEVYAMPDCPGWHRATALVAAASAAGIAGLAVRSVDLTQCAATVPESVIASPTWLLDGRRIALGNPDPAWLLAHLRNSSGR
jgi:hypothetical protein